jgi:hypothetical protein
MTQALPDLSGSRRCHHLRVIFPLAAQHARGPDRPRGDRPSLIILALQLVVQASRSRRAPAPAVISPHHDLMLD